MISTVVESALGFAYAQSRNKDRAHAMINELTALNKDSAFISYHVAAIYAGLGEKEQAFNWLERAYHERDIFMGVRAKTDPKLDNLRSDQRFEDLLRRIGLIP